MRREWLEFGAFAVFPVLSAVSQSFVSASTQLASGTVLVFQITTSEFVIAADSRECYPDKPPDDNACKIGSLDKNFAVGVGGTPGYKPGKDDPFPRGWDALEIAKQIAGAYIAQAPRKDAEGSVRAIVDMWADTAQKNWQAFYKVYPQSVSSSAHKNNQVLTNGLFAFARDDVAFTIRSITFGDSVVQIEHPPLPNCGIAPCASGQTDVPMEFITVSSDRAREDHRTFKVSQSDLSHNSYEMLYVAHLVDLAITLDKSGTVGGHVNGVELLGDGTIRSYNPTGRCAIN